MHIPRRIIIIITSNSFMNHMAMFSSAFVLHFACKCNFAAINQKSYFINFVVALCILPRFAIIHQPASKHPSQEDSPLCPAGWTSDWRWHGIMGFSVGRWWIFVKSASNSQNVGLIKLSAGQMKVKEGSCRRMSKCIIGCWIRLNSSGECFLIPVRNSSASS